MRKQVLLWTAISVAAIAVAQTNNEETVRGLENRYLQASQSNDISFIDSHIAVEYLGIQPDGTVLDRDALLAARRKNLFVTQSIKLLEQQIRVTRDTAAVTECLVLGGYSVSGQRMDGDYQLLRVWQKTGNDWKVIAFQMSRRVAPCSK